MSRYIDADALKKDIARLHVLNDEAEIRRTYEYNPHVTTTDFEETLVSVFDAIDDAPSIDAVELGVDYRLDFYEVNYKSWRDENGVEHMRTFCIERKESE